MTLAIGVAAVLILAGLVVVCVRDGAGGGKNLNHE
jgi:hypothetical protein